MHTFLLTWSNPNIRQLLQKNAFSRGRVLLHRNVNKSSYNAPIFKIETPPQSRHSDAPFGVWHVYLSGMTSPTKNFLLGLPLIFIIFTCTRPIKCLEKLKYWKKEGSKCFFTSGYIPESLNKSQFLFTKSIMR